MMGDGRPPRLASTIAVFRSACPRPLRLAACVAAGLVTAVASVGPCRAQTVEQFYQGRQMTIVVGFNPGGGYDPYARTLARHLPHHLPGSPDIVVRNMPGAGSIIAANYLYNRAPRDGSEIGMIAGPATLDPIYGRKTALFDGQRFTWLGSAFQETGGCFAWHTAPFQTVQDLFTAEMVTGVTGPGSGSFDFPAAMNAVLGTKMKLVRGYKGAADLLLAVERGESQGMCGSVNSTLAIQRPEWLPEKKVRILVQIGLERNARMGDRPFLLDLAKTDDDRRLLRLMVGWTALGRAVLAPPDIPADRREALVAAFDATLHDPAFIEDAASQRLEISPVSAAQIDRFLADVYATPKPLVERAAKILRE
jgi:tripartite-type tricarboxylate transporter receptor subunit TctC